jgi:Rieske Fe-S protein
MNDMTRRGFLFKAAATAVVISLPVLQTEAADAPAKPAPPNAGPVDAGLLSSYNRDGISDKFAHSNRIFIIRDGGKLFAASATCPHRGALITLDNGNLHCKRHNSFFSIEGTVTDGPAKSSLPRYAISLDDKKHVIVDKSKSFKESQWDDPASFIDLKAL